MKSFEEWETVQIKTRLLLELGQYDQGLHGLVQIFMLFIWNEKGVFRNT